MAETKEDILKRRLGLKVGVEREGVSAWVHHMSLEDVFKAWADSMGVAKGAAGARRRTAYEAVEMLGNMRPKR